MDDARARTREALKHRFQVYKECQLEVHSHYMSVLPAMEARDRAEAEQFVQQARRNQGSKSNKAKQYESHKQLPNSNSNDHQNANISRTFDNADILQKASQKRSYESFNGGTSIKDSIKMKISRLNENPYQNAHANIAYDMNSNIQPNINPFQQHNTNTPKANVKSKTTPIMNLNSISSPDTGNVLDINDILSDGLKNIEKVSNMNHVKIEPVSSGTNLTSNQLKLSENAAPVVSDSAQFTDSSLVPLGDLDVIGGFALFGEITGNTSANAKIEGQTTSVGDAKLTSSNSQIANTHSMSIPSSDSIITSMNTLQSNVLNTSLAMLRANRNAPMTDSKNVNSNNVSNSNSQSQLQMNSNRQQGGTNHSNIDRQLSQSPRNVNLHAINAVLMNQQNQNKLNNMQSPLSNSPISPMNMQQATGNMSMQSPAMSTTVSVPPQAGVPPNLQRPPNLRQHIVERMNRQQQQQAMMSNMVDMNNPYVQNTGGPTREKLHEHIKKRQEQYRLHQMSRNQFMNQQMMPSQMQNTMQQQMQFQFPNDFQSYNQHNMYEQMNIPSQTNAGMGFYPPPYQMDNLSNHNAAGMFAQTVPPGYSQQNRAGVMLRNLNLMRDQKQMNDMITAAQLGGRQSVQPGMYNNKAPPQYSNQGMESRHMLMNQGGAQTGSKLSHFSQPDTSGMQGMTTGPPGLTQTPQMRLRNPMPGMNRYPAPPSLQRSASLPNNNSNIPGSPQQFGNYASNQLDSSLMNLNNPLYQNQNWTSEQQQQLLYMKRQHQQQQQLNFSAQQQQSSLHQSNFPNLLNSTEYLPNSSKTSSLTLDTNFNSTNQTFATNYNQSNQLGTPNSLQTKLTNNLVNGKIESNNQTSPTTVPPTKDGAQTFLPSSESVDDSDLDNLLNNPPEHFDLFQILSM